MDDTFFKNSSFIKMSDYENLDNIKKKSIYNKIQNLYAHKKIKKIKNGLWTMINPLYNDIYVNKYEIGTAMFDNAYIGYHTALEYYGLHNQISREVQVLVERREKSVEFDNYIFRFYQGDGVGVVEKSHIDKIRITSLEKTIYDCINNINFAGGLEELYSATECINYIDEEKLLKLLNYYSDDKMFQKVGWLFDTADRKLLSNDFYSICKSKIKNRIDLRVNKKNRSKYFKDWDIVAPRYIFANGIIYGEMVQIE